MPEILRQICINFFIELDANAKPERLPILASFFSAINFDLRQLIKIC